MFMCELLATDGLGLLEGFERMLPALDVDALEAAARHADWPVHVVLGDSLSANKLMWEILVFFLYCLRCIIYIAHATRNRRT